MKIVLINGSPKVNVTRRAPSASEDLLIHLKKRLQHHDHTDIEELHLRTASVPEDDLATLLAADVWIFSFPLYASGIPAHLLSAMRGLGREAQALLEKRPFPDEREIYVYAIVNGSLFEGNAARPALEMMEHWCLAHGLIWGSGLGVGGGTLLTNSNIFSFPYVRWSSLSRCMEALTLAIDGEMSAGNFYCAPDIRKKIYVTRINRYIKTFSR